MKLFRFLLTLALYAFALAQSLANIRCHLNCDLHDFKPICGIDDAGKTKTFNNLCILKTENCLRHLSFQKTSDGVCP